MHLNTQCKVEVLTLGHVGHLSYLHSFIMPMSTQRLSRHAWQWRLLSLVMVQLPLKGHVKLALRFILRLNKYTFYSQLKLTDISVYKRKFLKKNSVSCIKDFFPVCVSENVDNGALSQVI